MLTPAKKKALWRRTTSILFWVAILGAVKLCLDPVGLKFDDAQVNTVANALSALSTVVGIFLGYGDGTEQVEQVEGPQ